MLKSQNLPSAEVVFNAAEPEISVVMPVFNQKEIISTVLGNLDESMTLFYELILIDDASSDGSFEEVMEFLGNLRSSTLSGFRVFRARQSQFETSCDVFGFSVARAPFLLEIQADMFIRDPGFDSRFVAAMTRFPDLVALSGRGAEPIFEVAKQYKSGLGSVIANQKTLAGYVLSTLARHLPSEGMRKFFRLLRKGRVASSHPEEDARLNPQLESFLLHGRAGRLGREIENFPTESFPRGKIWLSHTVMRGPLFLDALKYNDLGGFDQSSFFLGYDDHEFMIKAFLTKGYRCGFTPVNFRSPLGAGSTRKMRSIRDEAQILFKLLKISRKRKQTILNGIDLLRQTALPEPEVRTFRTFASKSGIVAPA
jgi:glycosyltransferase involved in cell wall biosynthesis